MSALFGLTSAAIGGGLGFLNNIFGARSAEQARAENYEYNEMAAQNADTRTRNLYKDIYSPKALLKQYKEAGLSPSLMFGGTPGQGGTPGAQGGGAAGVNTPYMPISLLEGAQIAKIQAETKKTEAEARNIDPVANATVSSLLAESGYKNAAAAAAAAQATGQELDNYVKENTKEASIYTICELADKAGYEASKTYYEMKDAELLNEFNQDTLEDRKKIMHEQLNQLVQSIAESKSVEKLNNQQKSYLKIAILNSIDEANREWAKYDLSVQQFETFLDKQIPIIEKQLDVELEKLGIEKRKLVINAVTDTFKSLAMGAMAASSMGLGKGSNQSKPISDFTPKKASGGNALNKGVPVYKQNTVWSY